NLSLILESGNHLISILNDILDLTKVEQNKIELESSPFTIEQIIAPLRSTYQAVCQEKGIRLNIECYIDANTTFLGDRNRVRQVLYNLLNNAIKFTE
ncbi:sensor histidine kinase, partial [Vibrio alfacsensis]